MSTTLQQLSYQKMIKILYLQNFKCFEDQKLTFKPLTLLSGFNNAGKSSLIQALLLLRQSYQHKKLVDNLELTFNGNLIHLGTAKDVLFKDTKKDSMHLKLELEDNTNYNWSYNYNRNTAILSLASSGGNKSIIESSLFHQNFDYLTGDRVASPHPLKTLNSLAECSILNPNLCHPKQQSLLLKDQIEAWLYEISPNLNLTNVSTGIIHLIPILIAILTADQGSLLILENPETHMHPKVQSKIADLLTRAANSGIQIIIETHSDHMLNGIRVAVHDGKLSPDDVQLHFFQQILQRNGVAQIISPKIDQDGRLDRWPDGFFDQWEIALEALLEPSKWPFG